MIRYTDEAPEKTKEECCPGAPYMNFSTKQGVSVCIINPQKYSGLFRMDIIIADGDTIEDIISRILKENKVMKGMHKSNRFDLTYIIH